MDSIFCNYHYRVHEVHLYRQLSAAQECAIGPALNLAPGRIGKHLKAYVCSRGVGKIPTKYLKNFSDSLLMEHPNTFVT
jgi:hypothetical protein